MCLTVRAGIVTILYDISSQKYFPVQAKLFCVICLSLVPLTRPPSSLQILALGTVKNPSGRCRITVGLSCDTSVDAISVSCLQFLLSQPKLFLVDPLSNRAMD